MAKTRGLDAKLARLNVLKDIADAGTLIEGLRTLLLDSSNLIVSEAAGLAAERGLRELNPDLASAFNRFLLDSSSSDKGCRALTALIDALNRLEYGEENVFLSGIRHVQVEHFWGAPPEDMAAQLRADSAMGLVRLGHRDRLMFATDLLADPWKMARIGAARALGVSGLLEAVPLLRYKARIGDKEAEVTTECLTALVRLSPEESLPYVAEFFNHPQEELREGAALALAETRLPAALTLLKEYWPRAQPGTMQEVVLMAIALVRLPASLDFLLEILAGGDRSAALAVIPPLAIHRHNPTVRDQVAAVVAARADDALRTCFIQKFKPGR